MTAARSSRRRRLRAPFALLGAVLAVALGAGPAAADAGRLIRAEFRDCQILRIVYADVPPDTIVTWRVSQFGKEVDRGAFVSDPGPAANPRVVNLRLRVPVEPGTDAAFTLDAITTVRRKPQCDPVPGTTAPVTTAPTPTTMAPQPPSAVGPPPGGDPTGADPTLPDGLGEIIGTEEPDGEPGSIARVVLPVVLIIFLLACGLAGFAILRRPGPPLKRAPERPLPPWLHTPVPKKRSWFKRQ